MKKDINTFDDYFNDETRVSQEEREKINFEVELIGKRRMKTDIITSTTAEYNKDIFLHELEESLKEMKENRKNRTAEEGGYNKKAYQFAIENTKYNSDGKAVISKEDEWKDESEWDDIFERIKKEG